MACSPTPPNYIADVGCVAVSENFQLGYFLGTFRIGPHGLRSPHLFFFLRERGIFIVSPSRICSERHTPLHIQNRKLDDTQIPIEG